ncbi:uncharacterized protein CcaverHIS019_0601560 [Cutaneotrichosporon cavernicola]|uniref:SET domain-containing protein n=1 Tax=Cutaneotrichosporon cavernicola TaxID=279322 RepID=A0AA48L865_9TREE|nr:uncharacterized protein CcaverHIS019_0601560 [Cutaneotrichosporon cavernicola]BEI93697.1 hypothetical protein CcaverHIS019_0601560 [Cutaneotrichosporon cavernicola]
MVAELYTAAISVSSESKSKQDAKPGSNGIGPLASLDAENDVDPSSDTALLHRAKITARLADSPYDLIAYLERAHVHLALGYPDLAAGDAYRALLLADEARTEGFEYHDEAAEALASYAAPQVLEGLEGEAAQRGAAAAYRLLAFALLDAGCLSSAAKFLRRGLDASPNDTELATTRQALEAAAAKRLGHSVDIFAPGVLPDTTLVRREVYPWNTHEPDRFSEESLTELNTALQHLAPKCAVQVVVLPVLLDGVALEGATCSQLGLFAVEDIAPGEKVLEEYSLLTANNRMKDSVCDACSSELPRDRQGVVMCDECYDTVFCSAHCAEQAERYHPAVCGTGCDEIGKDPVPHEADESLHLLLLARVLAVAAQGEIHPLDVPEVKYICGDFTPHRTLPWNFKYNVEKPLHILETMDVDIYAHPEFDLWVLNTIYAKTRGTASARKNPLDGKPDVATVHPLWCLANHDCDPNVWWDWAGTIALTACEERIAGSPGVKKGQEILNHYCDIRLPVTERREWASGPLGAVMSMALVAEPCASVAHGSRLQYLCYPAPRFPVRATHPVHGPWLIHPVRLQVVLAPVRAPAMFMSSEHVVVRQSEDWARVLVASKESAAADNWVLAFSSDRTEPAGLALLGSAQLIELEGRLEPANAARLETLVTPRAVRINNTSRGPRSSLRAPVLIVEWHTASSYVLPDLHISPLTTRLVVEISDVGGPISPANRRFLPALSSLDVADIVLDFSRWDCAVVDPFVARALYSTIAGLLVRGTHVTLVDFDLVFSCMADSSIHMRPTRYTSLPRRAEDALKFHLREMLRATECPDARVVEVTIRKLLKHITVLSADQLQAKL